MKKVELSSLRDVISAGTSTFDAENIYTDKQDGFMMQFASQGQFGRGIYFAEEACKTHTPFCSHFNVKWRSTYQDRLGTNLRKSWRCIIQACYSANYATKAATLQPDVREAKGMALDESEFLLANILIGACLTSFGPKIQIQIEMIAPFSFGSSHPHPLMIAILYSRDRQHDRDGQRQVKNATFCAILY
jgi:hypothetical protein